MSETWRQRHHRATREELLAAARGLMLEEGFDGLGVRELARRTGFGPASLYTYFSGKDAILAAIAGESSGELLEYLDRVSGDVAPRERLVRLCRAYLMFAEENPVDLACLVESGLRGGATSTSLHAGLNVARERLAATIADARSTPAVGEGTEPAGVVADEAAAMLLAWMHGVAVMRHAGEYDVRDDGLQAMVGRAVDAIIAG